MDALYTDEEFKNTRPYEKLPRKCQYCKEIFYVEKRHLLNNNRGKFCSHKCSGLFRTRKITIVCKNCGIETKKRKCFYDKYINHFCSQSCASKYNNLHKTNGTRKSKLEKYLEAELIKLFPDMVFHFNQKDVICSELDIYIPSLRLAFEINGIFHYEPIHGKEKLYQIQNNDKQKLQACLKNNINLRIINCSQHKYITNKTCEKYLNLIIKIIQEKVG